MNPVRSLTVSVYANLKVSKRAEQWHKVSANQVFLLYGLFVNMSRANVIQRYKNVTPN